MSSEAAVGIKKTTSYLWPSGTVYHFPLKDTVSLSSLMFQPGSREWDQALENEELQRCWRTGQFVQGEPQWPGLFPLPAQYPWDSHFLSNGIVGERFIFRLRSKTGIFQAKMYFFFFSFFFSKRPTLSFAFHFNQIQCITQIWVYCRTSFSCKPNAGLACSRKFYICWIKCSKNNEQWSLHQCMTLILPAGIQL